MNKKIFTIIAIWFMGFKLNSQSLSINFNYQDGTINTIYKSIDKYVFKLSEKGELISIYAFNSQTQATRFLNRPDFNSIPTHHFILSRIGFYVSNFSSIDYIDSYNSENRGKIKQINDITFDYYSSHTTSPGNVNRLSRIRNIAIRYDNMGRVNRLGTFNIRYFSSYYSNTGKIRSLGSVNVDYFSSYNSVNVGKVQRIGQVRINFFNRSNGSAKQGKFKSIIGNDDRFVFVNSINNLNNNQEPPPINSPTEFQNNSLNNRQTRPNANELLEGLDSEEFLQKSKEDFKNFSDTFIQNSINQQRSAEEGLERSMNKYSKEELLFLYELRKKRRAERKNRREEKLNK